MRENREIAAEFDLTAEFRGESVEVWLGHDMWDEADEGGYGPSSGREVQRHTYDPRYPDMSARKPFQTEADDYPRWNLLALVEKALLSETGGEGTSIEAIQAVRRLGERLVGLADDCKAEHE